MAKPTQQELMAAHNIARHNADKAAEAAKKNSTIVAIVDPRRKPEQLPPDHPFGGNDNNRRVAERILRESKANKAVSTPAPVSPAQAAQDDLDRADELDALDGVILSDEELELQQDAETAAVLAAKQAQEAIDAEADPAKKAALIAAVDGPAKPAAPPPAWKQNA